MRLLQRLLAFFLSFALIFSSTSAFAASPVGWSVSPADIIINGATATITAIKGAGSSALQSTVNHAPTVGNIGKKILKGAGGVAVAYAVTELIGAGVDWVLDPANNRIKYGGEGTCQGVGWYAYGFESQIGFHSSPAGACAAMDAKFGQNRGWSVSGSRCTYGGGAGKVLSNAGVCDASNPTYVPISPPQYIPISTVAQKVQSNAAAGHAPSQELIRTVVIDDINAGVLDAPFNVAAVPQTDVPPVVPPWTPDQPVPPFDPSSIIAAIKSVMAAVVNMSGLLGAKIDSLMIDLGLKHEEKLVADAANTAEIVAANDRTGAQVAAIAAAIADIEGNTLDGKVINDAVDRAIAAGNSDTASIVAAIEAIEGNTLDGQVINDAVDRVIANDNANSQSAADAANTAAEAAKAADAANTAAVTDAIDAQTDAITQTDPETGDLSLKFPVFCGWAGLVCDAAQVVIDAPAAIKDFFKEPDSSDTDLDIPDVPLPEPNTDINFGGSCPADLSVNFNLYGTSTDFVLMPFSKFCPLLSTFVKPTLIVLGSFFAVSIVGGRRDE